MMTLTNKYPEYRGLSYEGASRRAQKLVHDNWYQNFERLAELRQIMELELRKPTNGGPA